MSVKEKETKKAVWQMNAEEVEQALDTDAVRGLSVKEARKRLNHRTAEPLFSASGKSIRACVRMMLSDPAVWLLVAVGVLAMCFERVALGLICTVLAVVNGVVCGLVEYRSELFDRSMQQADAPLCRVVRNGVVVRISSRELVVGDVLILNRGDLVPADARLIAGKGLRVADPSPAQQGKTHMTERNVTAEPLVMVPEGKTAYFYENMVNGGGMVLEGYGRAVVTAVGLRTHLGAMSGPVLPQRHSASPMAWRLVKENRTALYIAMLACVLPLVGVAILASSDEHGLLDMVLTALSLVVVCVSRYSLCWMRAVATRMRAATAKQYDTENAAEIKTVGTMEDINRMTDLVVVGTAALHDGILHPETVFCQDHSFAVGRSTPEEEVVRWSALLNLICRRWQFGLADPNAPLCGESRSYPSAWAVQVLSQWTEVDLSEWELRLLSVVPIGEGVRLTYKDGTVQDLFLTQDGNCLYRVDDFRTKNVPAVATEAQRHVAYTAYREAVQAGHHVWFLLSKQDGRTCLEGFLTLSYHGCRKTKGCIRDMEQAGICVTVFLSDESPENRRFLRECGFDEESVFNAAAGRATLSALDLQRQGIRAFVGMDGEYIMDFLRDLRKKNRCVGVLISEDNDLPILHLGHVPFACSPDTFAGCIPPQVSADSVGDDSRTESHRASDLVRRRAAVLVRRCSENGGGLCGIRNAILCSRQYARHADRSLRYLLTVQAVRLLFVCMGLVSLPSAVILLTSGWALDAVVLALYGGALRARRTKQSMTMERRTGVANTFRSYIPSLMTAVVATTVVWTVLWMLRISFEGLLTGLGGQAIMAAGLLMAQIIVAVFCYVVSGTPHRKRSRKGQD